MRISSGAPWEATASYSRAVRVGDAIFVSGTVAMKDGAVVGVGDAGAQARRIFEIMDESLASASASLNDVVRIRMFVTDRTHLGPVLAEFRQTFAQVRPAASIYIIAGLIEPDLLVEIEADAIAGSAAPDSLVE